MNNCNFTFNKFREITKSQDYNNFVNLLNSLSGDNVYEKFITFLKIWKEDVSPSIGLNINGNNTEVYIDYIINCFPSSLNCSEKNIFDFLEITIDIPRSLGKMDEILPIYDIISTINIHNYNKIDLNDLVYEDKKKIVDNLPATIYKELYNKIIENKKSIVSLDNPRLEHLKFNFFTTEPFHFIHNMIKSYNKDYYRDVIYILSKNIDGEILLNSTISDIDYFLKKKQEDDEHRAKNGLDI